MDGDLEVTFCIVQGRTRQGDVTTGTTCTKSITRCAMVAPIFFPCDRTTSTPPVLNLRRPPESQSNHVGCDSSPKCHVFCGPFLIPIGRLDRDTCRLNLFSKRVVSGHTGTCQRLKNCKKVEASPRNACQEGPRRCDRLAVTGFQTRTGYPVALAYVLFSHAFQLPAS